MDAWGNEGYQDEIMGGRTNESTATNEHVMEMQEVGVQYKTRLGEDLGSVDATTTAATLAITITFRFSAMTGKTAERGRGTPMCSLALTSPRRVARCACIPVARRDGIKTPRQAAAMKTATGPTARMPAGAYRAKPKLVRQRELKPKDAEDAAYWNSFAKEMTMFTVHGNKRDCVEGAGLRKRPLRKLGIEDMSNVTGVNALHATELRGTIEAARSGTEVQHTPIERYQEMQNAEGKWDHGTYHELTMRTKAQLPARGRAVQRRRKGPGHAALRTPSEVKAWQGLPRAGISRRP